MTSTQANTLQNVIWQAAQHYESDLMEQNGQAIYARYGITPDTQGVTQRYQDRLKQFHSEWGGQA